MAIRMKGLLAAAILLAGTGIASAKDPLVVSIWGGNWRDGAQEAIATEFTKRTGIKINYDVYDSNEVLEAKLLVGKSGYDVVFPSAMPYLARQVKAGVYRKLDFNKLPNAVTFSGMNSPFIKGQVL